jgi:cell division protein ZapA
MCSDENVLNVRIYGAEYPIRQEGADDIKAIADYVDNKMHEVDKNVRVDSSLKVAILACLNITEELFRERKEKEEIRFILEDKIKKLNELIDNQMMSKIG